jgi:glycosyltransferase involved in cell wall biosynthesis
MCERISLFMPAVEGGGAERVMLSLAGEFSRRGYEVDLVLSQARGAYLERIPPAVRVVDLRCRKVLHSLPRVVRYLRRERPTQLLAAMNNANLVALWSRSLARVDTQVTVVVQNALSPQATHTRHLATRLVPLAMRFSLPSADGVVAVSGGVADDVAATSRFPRERIAVIYNPTAIEEVNARAAEPVPHPWFAPGAPPVIVGVGRLVPQKDFAMLLRAFARLRQRRDCRLVILGEGPGRRALEAWINSHGLQQCVSLPGFAPNPYAYLKRAAVFALSSEWEGCPQVLTEALATGTRIVSTDCPSGPAEILEQGRYGRLTPVGDDERFADALSAALDESPDPERQQERGRDFSIEAAATQYLSLFRSSAKGAA